MGRKSNTYRCHFCKNRFYKTLGVLDNNKDFICNSCIDRLSSFLAAQGLTVERFLETLNDS